METKSGQVENELERGIVQEYLARDMQSSAGAAEEFLPIAEGYGDSVKAVRAMTAIRAGAVQLGYLV